MPSDALIQLTLTQAKVPHRLPGRPRHGSAAPATPFLRPSPPPSPTRRPR
jgi:hypothetical protein